MINLIISKCSKLEQKDYETRHDWVGMVIHWELCKNFKFNYTNKWYIHNSESVLKNETHKILWNFEIKTDLLISTKKRTCRIVDFAVPTDHWIKLKESEKRDEYQDLAREQKKLWNM